MWIIVPYWPAYKDMPLYASQYGNTDALAFLIIWNYIC